MLKKGWDVESSYGGEEEMGLLKPLTVELPPGLEKMYSPFKRGLHVWKWIPEAYQGLEVNNILTK